MPRTTQKELLEQIIKNNTIIQKKITDILINLDSLTKDISKIVKIFEQASKEVKTQTYDLKPIEEKIDSLINQNRAIANTLLLLEKYLRQGSVRPSPRI